MTDRSTALPTNQLLCALPPDVALQVHACIEAVQLEAGEVLYEAGSVLRHVHFPVTAVVSLVSPLRDGAGAEVAVVGAEGVAGVCAFMGGGNALSRAVVQRPGTAWRMAARDVAALARDLEPVRQLLLRYAQVLFTHMAQTSACHRHHALMAQLCRWLLQHLDRQAGCELQVTHERIAGLLGVRREGVTSAALKLQRQGFIAYRRGHIRVLDRRGLEQHSCECYGATRRAFAQLPGCAACGACNGAAPGAGPSKADRSGARAAARTPGRRERADVH